MKKALTLTAIGLLCFALGTVGIYFAMPSLAPDTVDHARVRLDSLGLLRSDGDTLLAAASDSLVADSTDSTAVVEALPTPQDIIQSLKDSINVTNNLVRSLQADTSALSARVGTLTEQLDELTTKDFEATELSKSLAKLDAKQLGQILAGIDLQIIELLYEKASAREKTRLLESMSPEQAARFVRTLVNGPLPEPEPGADAPEVDPTTEAETAPSRQ